MGRIPQMLALASLSVFGAATLPAAAAPAPPIYVDGERTAVPAIERGGTVFVPIRGVFEKLGAAVTYTPPGTVLARKGARDVARLAVGSRAATVHGQAAQLEAAPFLANSHVFVPLRLISESAGAGVAYASAPRSIRITSARTGAVAAVPAVAAATATAAPAATDENHGIPWWVWLLLALLLLGLLFFFLRRRKADPIISTSATPRGRRDRP